MNPAAVINNIFLFFWKDSSSRTFFFASSIAGKTLKVTVPRVDPFSLLCSSFLYIAGKTIKVTVPRSAVSVLGDRFSLSYSLLFFVDCGKHD